MVFGVIDQKIRCKSPKTTKSNIETSRLAHKCRLAPPGDMHSKTRSKLNNQQLQTCFLSGGGRGLKY